MVSLLAIPPAQINRIFRFGLASCEKFGTVGNVRSLQKLSKYSCLWLNGRYNEVRKCQSSNLLNRSFGNESLCRMAPFDARVMRINEIFNRGIGLMSFLAVNRGIIDFDKGANPILQ